MPAPQFWLKNTTLLTAPEGKPKLHVDGPVLIELLPNGHVRGVNASDKGIDGYLPWDVLERPQRDRGLMLYAQTLTELRANGGMGPVIGRLHPGAFVSVVRLGDFGTLVGSLPFEPTTMVGYVRSYALGVEPQEPEWFTGKVGDKSYVIGLLVRAIESDFNEDTPYTWPCEPILFADYSGFGSQYIDGVELYGRVPSYSPSPAQEYPPSPRSEHSRYCLASHVVYRGDELTLVTSRQEKTIDRLPWGFVPIHDDGRAVFRDWIERGRSIFWLLMDYDWELYCASVRFVGSETTVTTDGAIVDSNIQFPLDDEGKVPYLPIHSHFYNDEARLTTVVVDGLHPYFRRCDMLRYRLVHTLDSEFHMLARRIPDESVAYDPGEAERWFRTQAACESARVHAKKVLTEEGYLAHTLGIRMRYAMSAHPCLNQCRELVDNTELRLSSYFDVFLEWR